MWLFEIRESDRSTRLTKDGILVSTTAYSGCYNTDEEHNGYNNPKFDYLSCVGPIPEGLYIIKGPPFDHPERGPYCLRLEPYKINEMYGRSGFLVHGKPLPPRDIRTGSDGCMCADHDTRMKMFQSGDVVLQIKYLL